MILKIIILLFSAIIICGNINVLTYDEPGIYTLTPLDYGYSSEIIVKLWGAGAGGNGCHGGGGQGGSYIKASVKTNLKTFNIKIGAGGRGGNRGCHAYCAIPTTSHGLAGNSSSLISIDKQIKLISNGGNSKKTNIIIDKVITYVNATGQEGQKSICVPLVHGHCPTHTHCCSEYIHGNGGSAYNGGFGGTNTRGFIEDINNGANPGGSGSGYLSQSCGGTNTYRAGDGGNGSIIIYYTKQQKMINNETKYKVIFAPNNEPGLVNFRKIPSLDGEIICRLKYGEIIRAISEPINGWIAIEHDGNQGYVKLEWNGYTMLKMICDQPNDKQTNKIKNSNHRQELEQKINQMRIDINNLNGLMLKFNALLFLEEKINNSIATYQDRSDHCIYASSLSIETRNFPEFWRKINWNKYGVNFNNTNIIDLQFTRCKSENIECELNHCGHFKYFNKNITYKLDECQENPKIRCIKKIDCTDGYYNVNINSTMWRTAP